MNGTLRHDKKVRETALRKRREGWHVRADIPGFRTPRTYGGCRADIEATKGSKKRIYEIETPQSMRSDVKQRRCLARAAAKQKNTKFITLLAR